MNKAKSILVAASVSLVLAFTFSCSSDDYEPSYGSLSYEDKDYRTVQIGNQTWMAENMNYEVDGSKCYGEDGQVIVGWEDEIKELILKTLTNAEVQANCEKYGRLYTWEMAKTVCPSGWHLPSGVEWQTLLNFAGELKNKKLKAKSGWNDYEGKSGNGTDKYGFSALPGGTYYTESGYFDEVGDSGIWCGISDNDRRYSLGMNKDNSHGVWTADGGSGSGINMYSVRCIKD